MYVLELAFDPTPERLAARPAHRERLQALFGDGRLVMAGPLADDSGALLIFEVSDEQALARLIDQDPYFTVPGVRILGHREWSPIIP